MHLIIVVGARPNFVKVGPLVPALAEAGVRADLAHTGQHYDASMSEVFFRDLEIPEPRWFLGVGSGTHAVQTGTAMMALEELFVAQRPDAVMVVGDVNSTLAGALAASKLQLPIAHLEAGLRSRDMSMPEEVNRLVTDQLASMLLTPTAQAARNLLAEGVDERRVEFVGNVMAESVLMHLDEIRERNACDSLRVGAGGYVLVTIHRPENTDRVENLSEILDALRECPLPVLMPVHPRTRQTLTQLALEFDLARTRFVDPVGYLDMLSLEHDAAAVITDSGGVQEETCVLHVPCVTVRRSTERQITIEVGANRLVPANSDAILVALDEALASDRDWETPPQWDERVSTRIADALLSGFHDLYAV